MNMEGSDEEVDQFQLLEDKIDNLIHLVAELKKEKEILSEKFQIQEGKLADLTERLGKSEAAMDMARQKVSTLLNKIEQSEI